MADRFWILGTGTWNGTNTVNWSASSGGVGGASVPTASDNVFFDANSDVAGAAFVVTAATATALCNDYTVSGLDAGMTFAGSIGLTVSGSLSVPASNFTRTYTGAITFNATATGKTITNNGVTWASAITFNGAGGGWTLADAFTTTGGFTLTAGDLDLGTYTLTCSTVTITGSTARSLTFGSGAKFAVTGNNATVWSAGTLTNFTLSGTPRADFTYSGSTGTRTIGHGTVAAGTEANSVGFYITAGTDTVSISANSLVHTLNFTGFAGTLANLARTIYGDLVLSTGMTVSAGANATTFGATSGTKTITSNGKTMDFPITFNGAGGTWQLQDAMTLGSTRTLTLTNGTIDLQTYTVTCSAFSSNNSNVRGITVGSGAKFVLTGNAATIWGTNTATNLTVSGALRMDCTYAGATGTRTVNHGGSAAGTEANSPSVYVTAGTDTFTLGGNTASYGTLDFTGFAGTFTNATRILYGSLVLSTGMTVNAGTSTTTFGATSGTKTITSNGKTIDFPVTIDGVGGTFQLADAFTMGSTRTFTLTNGTFDVSTYTATIYAVSSNNSNNRNMTFGSGGKYVIPNNNSTFWNFNTATNFTITGASRVELTYAGATGTRTIAHGTVAGATENNSPNFYVTGGTDTVTITAGVGVLDFTGFAGTFANAGRTHYGSLTLVAAMTLGAGTSAMTLGGTSGTKTITTAGLTLDFPITVNGVGVTWQLADALTMGSTRALTHTNGALDLNDLTLTTGTYGSANSNVRTLDFGTGDMVVVGSGASAFSVTATNLTVSYSAGASVSLTSASAKTFTGGGASWPTINQGGAGDLTILNSNTFYDITNTTQPATVLFDAGETQTFLNDFGLTGTAGNLITIGSDAAGTHTLSKASGTITVDYLDINDSDATGGATWNADTARGNVDGGGNSGWIFTGGDVPVDVTESLLVKLTDAGALDALAAVNESLLPKIDDVATLTVNVAVLDTLLPRLDDVAAVSVQAAVSDSVLPKLTDTAALDVLVAVTDTLRPRLDDVAAVQVLVAVTESLLPMLVDDAALAAYFEAADTLTPMLTEAAAITVAVAVADAVLPRLDDLAALSVMLGVSDTALLRIDDTAALVAALDVADALLPMVDDIAALATALQVADGAALALAEAAALSVLVSVADQLDPAIIDAVASSLYIQTADGLTVTLADAAAAGVLFDVVDTLRPRLSPEVATVLDAVLRVMTGSVRVYPAIDGTPQVDASLGAGVTVRPSIGGEPSV